MHQGPRDPLGTSRSNPIIHPSLLGHNHLMEWMNKGSDSGVEPTPEISEPYDSPADPGRRYHDLESVDLNGPDPDPLPDSTVVVSPFVSPRMEREPTFVTNRDTDTAFLDRHNTSPSPTFGQAFIRVHHERDEDLAHLRQLGASILENSITRLGSQVTWKLHAALVSRGYNIDYFRTDIADGDRNGGRSRRSIFEEYEKLPTEAELRAEEAYQRQMTIQPRAQTGSSSRRAQRPGRSGSERYGLRSFGSQGIGSERGSRDSQSSRQPQHGPVRSGAMARPRGEPRGRREQYLSQGISDRRVPSRRTGQDYEDGGESQEEEEVHNIDWEVLDTGEAWGYRPGAPQSWRVHKKWSTTNYDPPDNPAL